MGGILSRPLRLGKHLLEEKAKALGSESPDLILDSSLTCCATPGTWFIKSFSPEKGEITEHPEEHRSHAQSDIERKVVLSPTGWRAAELYCPVEGVTVSVFL